MNSPKERTFNPADYTFKWTSDGWYKWDYTAAHKAAKEARDEQVKNLRKSGKTVKPYCVHGNNISFGGIGSGHPHIEITVTIYGYRVY